MAANTSSRHIFETLRAVCAADEPLGVTELSRKLDLSLSTAQRALNTLVETGFLLRQPYRPKYGIGLTAQRLVNAFLERFPIRSAAIIPMSKLATSTHRTIALHLHLGWYSLRVARIESRDEWVRTLGKAASVSGLLHTTLGGRSILATLQPDQIDAYIRFAEEQAAMNVEGATPVPGTLREELRGFHQAGYGHQRLSDREAVAFPVRDQQYEALAAIIIAGPPGPEPLTEHPEFLSWQRVVQELEQTVRSRPELFRNPFAHIDPDTIRFGHSQ